MGYLVTARKWRPQVFSSVAGQEHITETLKNAIKNNRIAHAYLFTGPRGVGKTTTARIFAKALNCTNLKNAEPCNECDNCKDIQNSQLLDIIEIDGASNRGIDEVRTLRESVKYAPTRGKYKIYIIDEVHMLTKESFNAFLKTLEEPPEHTIFIFATTDVHKVPLTIISRCQRFDFRRIQMDTIKETLLQIAKAENIKIDDKTLTIISKKADGALRDAESYFDQVVSFCGDKIDSETVAKMLNLIDDEIYFEISDAILNKNFKSVFEVTNKIYGNGWDFIDFMEGLIEHFRNIMTVILTEKTSLTETADVYRNRYMDYIDKFSEGDLLRVLNFLTKVQQELKYSQNQKLKIEIALSHLIALEKSFTLSELISKINSSSIEKKSLVESEWGSSSSGESKPTLPPKEEKQRVTYQHPVISKQNEESKTSPIIAEPIQGEIDFEKISNMWQSFVDEISSERGLTLGPALTSLRLHSLSGNQINVSSAAVGIEKTMEINRKYLETKSELVFGKRLMFFLIGENETVDQSKEQKKPENKKPALKNNEVSDDPYEDVIINELGGVKIN
ncbi:DNA polymerase III subunit gamma/tau [bacterium BMS3Abin03]|jgi:DNA polymerase-3 subunit gamma/tau|nr:DNA polymerase III subunit gamma/tau [bacterium BMS3Abin03]